MVSFVLFQFVGTAFCFFGGRFGTTVPHIALVCITVVLQGHLILVVLGIK
jgi:hypothetical protein